MRVAAFSTMKLLHILLAIGVLLLGVMSITVMTEDVDERRPKEKEAAKRYDACVKKCNKNSRCEHNCVRLFRLCLSSLACNKVRAAAIQIAA